MICGRTQGDGLVETGVSRDVWARHVVGLFPCPGGHVFDQVPPKESRIPGRCPEFSPRYRSLDVGDKLVEEGMSLTQTSENA